MKIIYRDRDIQVEEYIIEEYTEGEIFSLYEICKELDIGPGVGRRILNWLSKMGVIEEIKRENWKRAKNSKSPTFRLLKNTKT